VDFSSIEAVARYPGSNRNALGGGVLYNVKFEGNAESTFTFPFSLK
jgi:hypothetical protein